MQVAQMAGTRKDNPLDLGSNPRSHKPSYYFSKDAPMRFNNVGIPCASTIHPYTCPGEADQGLRSQAYGEPGQCTSTQSKKSMKFPAYWARPFQFLPPKLGTTPHSGLISCFYLFHLF